jgi:hypothetical protein
LPREYELKSVYIQCCSCPANGARAYHGPSLDLYAIKCQVPYTTTFDPHFEKMHKPKKEDSTQNFLKHIVTGIGLLQRNKAKQPAPETLAVVPSVSVLELEVEQQVGNTCAPRTVITALESIYCQEELRATPYKEINQSEEGVGAEWIQPHLDACDPEQRIHVYDNIDMITNPQHHHLLLTDHIDIFVTTETTFGLIANTATAQLEDACLGHAAQVAPVDGACVPREKMHHWIYLEVNFDDLEVPVVYYADSQSDMEQGKKRHDTVEAAALVLAKVVAETHFR